MSTVYLPMQTASSSEQDPLLRHLSRFLALPTATEFMQVGVLTPSIARLTRSDLIKLFAMRLLISAVLVGPELIHAMLIASPRWSGDIRPNGKMR